MLAVALEESGDECGIIQDYLLTLDWFVIKNARLRGQEK
jgi:hypothetical protein